jgi:Holliday junction resolvase RusA-like endonuclease
MIIPITIKSRNVLDKLHWAKKSMLKKEYALLIRNQMRLNAIYEIATDRKYTVEIVSYRKKLLDWDNLVGGCKQLIDAMIDENFIWDDSPKYVDLKIRQKLNSDVPKLTKYHNNTWIARY